MITLLKSKTLRGLTKLRKILLLKKSLGRFWKNLKTLIVHLNFPLVFGLVVVNALFSVFQILHLAVIIEQVVMK